jgi:predicted secreted hydrolase
MIKRQLVLVFIVFGLALLVAGVAMPERRHQERPAPIVAPAAADGFALARPGNPPAFPTDFGAHPDYQTEWWYYTGNLDSADGRHFGYQLTFFRRALAPADALSSRASAWATSQVYMAHFALTDVTGRRFSAVERFARGAAGLAGTQAAPYRVWLEDWSVEEVTPGVRRLHAAHGDIVLDLTLSNSKAPVLQGERGYSQKGPDRGNASYYYSLTRLESAGVLRVGGQAYQLTGLSWMDHEWSTSALAADQVGWDWFALQLDDGSEIMLFHIRNSDGGIDEFSSGTVITADGATRRLQREDFAITSDRVWRSPRSGAAYPARWTIDIPSEGIELAIEPYLADQELNLSFTYWEGAVRLSGQHAGRSVRGAGYVEQTGYAATMQGQF